METERSHTVTFSYKPTVYVIAGSQQLTSSWDPNCLSSLDLKTADVIMGPQTPDVIIAVGPTNWSRHQGTPKLPTYPQSNTRSSSHTQSFVYRQHTVLESNPQNVMFRLAFDQLPMQKRSRWRSGGRPARRIRTQTRQNNIHRYSTQMQRKRSNDSSNTKKCLQGQAERYISNKKQENY